MEDELLMKIQDGLFETSKAMLLEQGKIHPIAYLVSGASDVESMKEDTQFTMHAFDEEEAKRPIKKDEYAIAAISMEMPDMELYTHLCAMLPTLEDFLNQGVAIAARDFGGSIEESVTRVLDLFLMVKKGNRKDIVAAVIKKLATKVNAHALIIISEAYSLENMEGLPRQAFEKDLSKEPKAQEVLNSTMEAATFMRRIRAPILREPTAEGAQRDSGKLIGLGDVIDTSSKDGDFKMTGRFLNLITPFD